MLVDVVMLGPPGAGKGTQAERLATAYRVPKISTGDILREAAHDGTEMGRAVQDVMAAGGLVGDALMIEIVRERLARPDAATGFVLDGFPRTVVQAEALDAMVAGRGPLVVLHLVVPAEILVARVSGRRICEDCGHNAPPNTPAGAACPTCRGRLVVRGDDETHVVRERLKVYEARTRPLVEYYRARPTFFAIDGNQPPDAVFGALVAVLGGGTRARPRAAQGMERRP